MAILIGMLGLVAELDRLADANFNNGDDFNDTFIFAAGDIGIEYNFDIPLLISLDFRPEIAFGDERYNNNDLDFDIALGLRYQF